MGATSEGLGLMRAAHRSVSLERREKKFREKGNKND